MTKEIALVSPLDAEYTGHRDAERRHRETLDWLQRRERELGLVEGTVSAAPDQHKTDKD